MEGVHIQITSKFIQIFISFLTPLSAGLLVLFFKNDPRFFLKKKLD